MLFSTISPENNFGNVTPETEKELQRLEDRFIYTKEPLVKLNSDIEPDLYDKYNVKIGLRNKNGTGVCVGLTNIADVCGYRIDEGKNKIAIPGKLYYRGIDIEDIVNACFAENRFGYEEVSYLLLFGKLPTAGELSDFNRVLGARRELPTGFARDMILTCPSRSIMNMLAREVLALYSYDESPDDVSIGNNIRQAIGLIARFPCMVAYSYQSKHSHFDGQSLHIHYPSAELSTAENVLRLIRPMGEYTELEAKLLDLCLILHAEHGGGNNSTFTTDLVSSTGTDIYSAIAAAIGSLKGPRHGGANIAVLGMLQDLYDNVSDINDREQVSDYLRAVVRGEANDGSGLIYGLGHAIYTVTDPRAQLLKKMAKKLAEENGTMDWYNLCEFIESDGPKIFTEETGIEAQLPANIDLYSGFVYRALNIPIDLATPLFATARISGWCAHRIEEITSSKKIMRPAYQCVSPVREYTPMRSRK